MAACRQIITLSLTKLCVLEAGYWLFLVLFWVASSANRVDRSDRSTSPPASACARAATFGTSPNISPVASTTTGPSRWRYVRRALACRCLSLLRFSSASAPLDRERRSHRALGIVFLRHRVSEKRHQPVPDSWRPCRPSPPPPPMRRRDRHQRDRAIPPHQVARQCQLNPPDRRTSQ